MISDRPPIGENPKKKIAEHLRNADRLVRANQLDEALPDIEQILALDPTNAYALAFRQKIMAKKDQTAKAPPAAKAEAEKKQQRKLAAIVFTDIVAYSAKIQKNESAALQLLELHNKLLRPIFLKHDGNVVKTIGDSFLAEFTSVLQAVRCAIEIQDSVVQHDATANEDSQFKLRIGIHLGDVVYQDNDILGDGVNIASRLQGRADPGGICVSQDVYNQIRNREGFQIEYIGETELKNILTPISLYKVLTNEEIARREAEAALQSAHDAGIAEAHDKKLQEYLTRAEQLILQGDFDNASTEVFKLHALEPHRPDAKNLEERIKEGRKNAAKEEAARLRQLPRETVVEMYAKVLRQALSGGTLTPEGQGILKNLRDSLQISDEENRSIEESARQ